jgi:hypothetical protein
LHDIEEDQDPPPEETNMKTILTGALLLLAAAPAAVQAQAWVQPEGKGRVITSVIYSRSDKGFDQNGDVIDINDYDQLQAYFNGEFGLTDDLTLLVTPSVRSIDVENEPFRSDTGFQFLDVGARYRVAQSDSTVFSLQAKGRLSIDSFRDQLAQVSGQGNELQLRGQVGHGFKLGSQNSFASVDAGYNFRSKDPPNEYVVDLAIGTDLSPSFMVIGNLYNTFSDSRGNNGFGSYRYHNVILSGVYDVSDSVSLQLGGIATVAGRNALRERGVIAGFWVHF